MEIQKKKCGLFGQEIFMILRHYVHRLNLVLELQINLKKVSGHHQPSTTRVSNALILYSDLTRGQTP